MKKKLLYFMHVDWDWIKQRPHFLAEELAGDFNVVALYPRSVRRAHLVSNTSAVKRHGVVQLPFARFAFIRQINDFIRTVYALVFMVFWRPDFVWVTFPTLTHPWIYRLIGKSHLVYDCMDDAAQFTTDSAVQARIMAGESELLQQSAVVLASSENLKAKVLHRGASPAKVHLIRNACSDRLARTPPLPFTATNSGPLRVAYVGTVADYIDFATLIHCCDADPRIELNFIGPVTTDAPAHRAFRYHGVVDHAKLGEAVAEYDCLIMPFVVNELILGVDPVKLYEYISFNKPIICCRYPEIERFSDFVDFYTTEAELKLVFNQVRVRQIQKYTEDQRMKLLATNTWSCRRNEVIAALASNDRGHAA